MAQGNPRSYDSSRRKAAAAATRHRILGEARRLFIERGYEATTIAAIAAAAGVAPDTVYATVGRKPVLFRLLVEAAISGTSEAVPALEREYVRRVRASTGIVPETLSSPMATMQMSRCSTSVPLFQALTCSRSTLLFQIAMGPRVRSGTRPLWCLQATRGSLPTDRSSIGDNGA